MEWESEPNLVEEIIDGFKTEIRRNSELGHLCGYVFLDRNHKYYGINYNDLDIDVHGGLTFSEQEGKYWKIGFDCAHGGDYVPYSNPKYRSNRINVEEYRNVEYVRTEIKNIINQMKSNK
jgi:hypothetical protein